MTALDNPNPEIKLLPSRPSRGGKGQTIQERVFDVIRDIRDPEHPHSLEELSVVDQDSISLARPQQDSPGFGKISISFTPTVPHCSLASIIGLSIFAKLRSSGVLDPPGEFYYKLAVSCKEGTHASADDINQQLSDKERVAAAFENPKIMQVLNECIDNLPP